MASQPAIVPERRPHGGPFCRLRRLRRKKVLGMRHSTSRVGQCVGTCAAVVVLTACGVGDHVLGYQSTHTEGGRDVAQGDQVADAPNNAPDSRTTCGTCLGGQLCDPSLGCVACLTDANCPASARFCVLGSCVQCTQNDDCGGTTPSCWLATQTCHPACVSNQQCADEGNAGLCNPSTGACGGCMTAADCPTSASVCDATTLQCVQCVTRADCAGTSTPACLRTHCAQCAADADCPGATPFCVLGGDSPGRCVQCLQNAQCPSTAPSCNAGTCGPLGG